jgi:hypothetical protein
MDIQMDYQSDGSEDDSGSGVRRLNRVIAVHEGHTYIYQYTPDESVRARQMVKLHVEEGTLHPYVGLMLVSLINKGARDGS